MRWICDVESIAVSREVRAMRLCCCRRQGEAVLTSLGWEVDDNKLLPLSDNTPFLSVTAREGDYVTSRAMVPDYLSIVIAQPRPPINQPAIVILPASDLRPGFRKIRCFFPFFLVIERR